MEEYFVEEKSNWDKLMDFLVFVGVFAVTIFLILEIIGASNKTSLNLESINGIYFYVNIVVFVIFSLDLIRLWRQHSGLKDFFAHCWLDVLATIPFGLIASAPTFEVLKWARIARLSTFGKAQKISRISKISKEFKAASHLKKEGDEFKKKHRV